MVVCGGYIIGEFGHLMVHKKENSAAAQWLILKDKFHISTQVCVSICTLVLVKRVN